MAAQTIVLFSTKGGSGKTLISVNLAVALGAAGKKTLAESGLTLITGDSMADAAQKVVKAVSK